MCFIPEKIIILALYNNIFIIQYVSMILSQTSFKLCNLYKQTFFYSTGSGAVALAHLDGSGTDEAVCTMVQRVQELALGYPEGRIELQLIGGFSDPRHYSDEIFYNVMSKDNRNCM